MNVLALCAGAGGLELGLHLALPDRIRVVAYVEREARTAAALVARMGFLGRAPIWDDVATFDGKPFRGLVDCIAGGFPCQPWSDSGRRLGTKDERWLWPEILRIITEVGPGVGFFENVPGLDVWGVRATLRTIGYGSKALRVQAAQVGAPHRRERVFILAYRQDGRALLRRVLISETVGNDQTQRRVPRRDAVESSDTSSEPRRRRDGCAIWPPPINGDWDKIPASHQPGLCRVASGASGRVDRIAMLGNAVVPLAAAYAFRTLAARTVGARRST